MVLSRSSGRSRTAPYRKRSWAGESFPLPAVDAVARSARSLRCCWSSDRRGMARERRRPDGRAPLARIGPRSLGSRGDLARGAKRRHSSVAALRSE